MEDGVIASATDRNLNMETGETRVLAGGKVIQTETQQGSLGRAITTQINTGHGIIVVEEGSFMNEQVPRSLKLVREEQEDIVLTFQLSRNATNSPGNNFYSIVGNEGIVLDSFKQSQHFGLDVAKSFFPDAEDLTTDRRCPVTIKEWLSENGVSSPSTQSTT